MTIFAKHNQSATTHNFPVENSIWEIIKSKQEGNREDLGPESRATLRDVN